MAKCNDCWCELFDITNGNCDRCVKSMQANEEPDLQVMLNRRAVREMENEGVSVSLGNAGANAGVISSANGNSNASVNSSANVRGGKKGQTR